MKIRRSLKLGALIAFLIVAALMARPPLFTIDHVADIGGRGLTPLQLWELQMTFTVEDPPCYEFPPSFSFVEAPSGATISRNGKISWTPQQVHSEKEHTFTVRARGFSSEDAPCSGGVHSDTQTFVVYVC